jgi:hypothetical protein
MLKLREENIKLEQLVHKYENALISKLMQQRQ